jgi:hypothetical protein
MSHSCNRKKQESLKKKKEKKHDKLLCRAEIVTDSLECHVKWKMETLLGTKKGQE